MYIFAVYHTEWCSLGQIKCVWNGQEEHWTLLGFTDPRVMLQKPRKLGNLHQLHKVSYSPSKSVMGVSVNFITSSLAYRMALVLHTTAFPAPLKFHCSSCSPPPFFCMKLYEEASAHFMHTAFCKECGDVYGYLLLKWLREWVFGKCN